MPRRKNTPDPAPAIVAPKSARVFSPRKTKDNHTLTRERIASDLDAFRKAGGTIEVLGITHTLKSKGPDSENVPPARPASATTPKSRH